MSLIATPMYPETRAFIPFATESTDVLAVGSDALLYVMAYGHTISVPTPALYFAEKVAVMSIARRDTPEAVLIDVNRAIDRIASSLRTRAKLAEKVAAQPSTPHTVQPADQANGNDGGQGAKLLPRVPKLPPAGVAIDPELAPF